MLCYLPYLAALAAFVGSPAHSANYYVASGGSDANPGTEERPWASFQKAADTAAAGDTVFIGEGLYRERVLVKNAGAPGKMITFKAHPGKSVVLDGTGKDGWWGVLSIQGQDYIRLEGIEIRNNKVGWGVLIEHEEQQEEQEEGGRRPHQWTPVLQQRLLEYRDSRPLPDTLLLAWGERPPIPQQHGVHERRLLSL